MARSDGSPLRSTFIVIATMLPSSPAAYSRTAYEPAGGRPSGGSYVDRSMFCFHVPISGSDVGIGLWPALRVDHTINARIRRRPRVMGTLQDELRSVANRSSLQRHGSASYNRTSAR